MPFHRWYMQEDLACPPVTLLDIYLEVVQLSKESIVVHHGHAGGPELDCSCLQVSKIDKTFFNQSICG